MRSIVLLALILVVSAASVRAQGVPPPPPPPDPVTGDLLPAAASPAPTSTSPALPPPPASALLVPYRAGTRWGFANAFGGMVVGADYRDVDLRIVRPGRLARVELETPEGVKWGAVAADGRIVLQPIYDEVRIRRDGVVFLRVGRTKGAATPSGRIIAPLGPELPDVEVADDGLLVVDRPSGPRGLFTADGDPIAVPAGADESFRYEGGVVAFSSGAESTGYGIVSLEHERVVRFPQYLEIYPFHADRALVSIAGGGSTGRLYGFVNRAGSEVVEPRYTSADVAGFAGGAGRARVGRNGKFGLIDVDGREVLRPKYDFIGKFSGGYAVVGNAARFGLVDVNGHETVPVAYDTLGFWISASTLDEGAMSVTTAESGGGDVLLLASLGGRFGIVEASGRVVVPIEYDEFPAEPYLSYAYVRDTALIWARSGTKYALIRRDGKVLIPPTYDAVRIVHETWSPAGFPVAIGDRWGFVNRQGKETIAPAYAWIASQVVGHIVVVGDGRRFGAFDPWGRMIVPVQFDDVEPYANDMARVRSGRLYGFARVGDGLVTAVDYEDGGPFTGGIAPVRRGGKWGLLDEHGAEVLGPTYDRIESATSSPTDSPRFLAVGERGKCGYVGGDGVPITAMDYDDYSADPRGADGEWVFRNGMACVSRGGRFGFVDVLGAEVVAPIYDAPAAYSGGEDFAYVALEGLVGFVDKTGRQFFDAPIDTPSRPAHTPRRKRQ